MEPTTAQLKKNRAASTQPLAFVDKYMVKNTNITSNSYNM
jgi:hypothetical protein